MAASAAQAIFIDRDGVVNEVIYHQDVGLLDTPFTVEQFRLLPRVAEAVARINQSPYMAILASNQPGVAKRHFSLETHTAIDEKLTRLLGEHDARLDDRFYCLHHPEAAAESYRIRCECRKPGPGMIIAAQQKHHLELSNCWMIGDSVVDIQAAQNAGVRSALTGKLHCYQCRLLAEKGVTPDIYADDLADAVEKILTAGR